MIIKCYGIARMLNRRLNPTWLNTFVTLVECGHFTQTAEKLFMTQPGVSQHISKLEKACGYALIDRSHKNFVVTEQGRIVYQHGKDLAALEQQLDQQLAFDDPYAGHFSLACSGAMALKLYPELLTLQAEHKNLVINLKAAPNSQILQDVKQGGVDIGLVTELPSKQFFDATVLGQEELCLVVPATVDLRGDLAEVLIKLGLISHPDAEHYLLLYFGHSGKAELERLDFSQIPIVGSINQIGQILTPITKGIGFTVLPRSAIDSFPAQKEIKMVEPISPVKETLYLIKQKNRQMPARFFTVCEILTQTLAEI